MKNVEHCLGFCIQLEAYHRSSEFKKERGKQFSRRVVAHVPTTLGNR